MSTIARPSTPPSNPAQTLISSHPAPSPARSPLAKRPKPSATTTTSISAPVTMSNQPAVPTLSSQPNLLIKLLTSSAQPPKRGSAFAAGYDIYASATTTIPARGKALVSTGIAIAVPEGTYGRIAPRSGLAAKNHIDTGAGVIDADYRGEVKVLLFNHAETEFEVKLGDRVAQLIVERIYTPEIQVVEELEESVRGAGGFGSTGVGVDAATAAASAEKDSKSGHDSHGSGGAGGIA